MSYIGQAQTSAVLRNVTQITATAGQTVFPVYGGYALGFVDVFMNGILLVPTADFTANDGANVTLLSGAAVGDELSIVAYTPTTQVANKAEVRQSFVATAGQTTFTVTGGYTPGMLSVYLNGVKMVNGTDVTASNGTTVVFPVGLVVGDVVDVVGLVSFAVADAVRKTGDVMTGDLDVMANMGVGTTTPNKGGVARAVTLNTSSGGNIVEMCVGESRIGWVYGDNNLTALAAGGNRRISLQTNNEERLLIDGSGRVTMPFQPAFYAMMNNTNISSTAAIVFEDVYVNRGSCYNSANGRFTAPVAGTYHFSANFLKRSGSGRLVFTKNDVYYGSGNGQTYSGNVGGGEIPHAATIIITLAAGDYINVVASIDSGDVYGNSNSHNAFSGFLLG
jgi:hypothetical protein